MDIIQNIDIRKKTVFDGKVDGLGRTFLKSRNIIKIATTKKKSKNQQIFIKNIFQKKKNC